MFQDDLHLSTVTAVLPNSTVRRVVDGVLQEPGANAFVWTARGTLLHDHWYKRWVPPISPVKTVLQMIVPDHEVDRVVGTVVERGRLNLQATGAVFSTPSERVYLGSEYQGWPAKQALAQDRDHGLSDSLSIIYCIVSHNISDRVARAAVNAGAHGPIVYYSEGRGLRDRLGWLRITKEHEKEVLMVLADDTDVEDVFDAMAKAGELHLPGRGFMYRFSIDKGMFNLPSRVSHHHYAANMQQIINAIDHLAGHNHWRDQSVSDVGGEGRSVGLDFLQQPNAVPEEQVCVAAAVCRDQMQALVDLLLDAGAPGLNFTYARRSSPDEGEQLAGAKISQEYAMVRCIVSAALAERIGAELEDSAEAMGVRDLIVQLHAVQRIATYVPGTIDYRQQESDAQVNVA